MLASGTQIAGSNPAEAVWLFGRKIPQHAFFRPMSQTCGMKKNPTIYVEVGIASQIDRPFLTQIRPSLTEVTHVAWRGAGGTKGGAQRALTLKA
jgi:hypothetical protein